MEVEFQSIRLQQAIAGSGYHHRVNYQGRSFFNRDCFQDITNGADDFFRVQHPGLNGAYREIFETQDELIPDRIDIERLNFLYLSRNLCDNTGYDALAKYPEISKCL